MIALFVSQVFCVRGDLECLLGNRHRGIESYSRALRYDAGNFSALIARAVARFHDGDCRSLEDCNQAVQVRPDNYRAYYYRWYLRRTLGHPQEARQDLKQACSLAGPLEKFWLERRAGRVTRKFSPG